MDYKKELEKHLKNNEELQKIFEKHPESKELYIQKMKDTDNECAGVGVRNPAWCRKCAFAHGDPPFADLPDKAYCEIYAHGTSSGKPKDVYFEGAYCEFYMKG